MKTSTLFAFALLALPFKAGAGNVESFGGSPQSPFEVPQGRPSREDFARLGLDEMRLVKFEDGLEVWMTELDKFLAKRQGRWFIDITDDSQIMHKPGTPPSRTRRFNFPTPTASSVVRRVIDELDVEKAREALKDFTSFSTRYYKSETGRQSQLWLLERITNITEQYATTSMREDIAVSEFAHTWGQNTIIARVQGRGVRSQEVVIMSAHQDSINWSSPLLPAPGADDDGSGTVTLLEAYRALLVSGFAPERSVEFHWYSGEEGGLLGSRAVVRDYQDRSIDVYAQIQFDMTAWVKNGTEEVVAVVKDQYVVPELATFVTQLVDAYCDIPHQLYAVGHATSDHASWTMAGYAGSEVTEGVLENWSEHQHTANDRMDVSHEFSITHMLEFSKVAVGFAVELGTGCDESRGFQT